MSRLMIGILVTAAWMASACNSTPQNVNADLEKRVEDLEKVVAEHDDRLKRQKRNPATTSIILSRASGSGRCNTAKVLDYRVGNQHERHVRWNIEVEDCTIPPGWRVELRFTPKDEQYPFPSQNLRSNNNRFIQDRIKPTGDVAQGVYSYTIYIAPAGSEGDQLADPELEVEPPPVVLAATAAAPPAAPANPPAKKQ